MDYPAPVTTGTLLKDGVEISDHPFNGPSLKLDIFYALYRFAPITLEIALVGENGALVWRELRCKRSQTVSIFFRPFLPYSSQNRRPEADSDEPEVPQSKDSGR
ncbi:hypothetical protein BDK51DRAFT_37601 [Blyttiomyces helicus]|uniref:Uncharacterized protein n=1 Tax=Blyttiomyces helicus TaxID=388810 RepID=A0A4P9WDJ3_9FUNG|nr:hypothetical protein BDK51DRAFT_37601 [Blyttiomyces helicus]|eukprot:RKO90769.1 hypothetical protein BDK51DRAFT_37601 [Blyttiomyces helicus]